MSRIPRRALAAPRASREGIGMDSRWVGWSAMKVLRRMIGWTHLGPVKIGTKMPIVQDVTENQTDEFGKGRFSSTYNDSMSGVSKRRGKVNDSNDEYGNETGNETRHLHGDDLGNETTGNEARHLYDDDLVDDAGNDACHLDDDEMGGVSDNDAHQVDDDDEYRGVSDNDAYHVDD